MKKPKSVIAVEKAAEEALKVVKNIEDLLEEKRIEYYKLVNLIEKTRFQEDEKLPQCQIVLYSSANGRLGFSKDAVIEKQLPSGVLVVREKGRPYECAEKYKPLGGRYVRVQTSESRYNTKLELCNVPDQFQIKVKVPS